MSVFANTAFWTRFGPFSCKRLDFTAAATMGRSWERECSPRDGLVLKCLFCFPDVLFLQETELPLMEETVSVKCVLNQWHPVQKNSPIPAVSIVSFLNTPLSGGPNFYFLLLLSSNVQCWLWLQVGFCILEIRYNLPLFLQPAVFYFFIFLFNCIWRN